jgi:ABC-2 type transport system ATP-binding protein/ribosome-dependent ATPase
VSGRRLVEASAVTRRFGAFTANDRIDLHVEQGEVVGLLGANGAGKTTLMRLLLGLLRPTSGTVRILGRVPSRAVRRQVGYVPQGLGLYEDLTVAENVEFAAAAFGTGAAPLDADLRAEARTLVRELPLGLRRRLAFATALGHDPALLVLDEPTSGVDVLGRGRLWDTIRGAAEGGAGVLVSTHYMEEAEHCDRLVVLTAGRVAVSGTMSGIIAGRRALQITAPRWDAAFQALDAAGIVPALHGRTLRLVGADPDRVAGVLDAAHVEAELTDVPANFEEAFVALAAEGSRS